MFNVSSDYSSGCPSSDLSPFYLGISFLKQNSRKTGALIIWGLLGNLVVTTSAFGQNTSSSLRPRASVDHLGPAQNPVSATYEGCYVIYERFNPHMGYSLNSFKGVIYGSI